MTFFFFFAMANLTLKIFKLVFPWQSVTKQDVTFSFYYYTFSKHYLFYSAADFFYLIKYVKYVNYFFAL